MNITVEKNDKTLCTIIKSSNVDTIDFLWQLLMLPTFFFVAGKPYFNQVVFLRREFYRGKKKNVCTT